MDIIHIRKTNLCFVSAIAVREESALQTLQRKLKPILQIVTQTADINQTYSL